MVSIQTMTVMIMMVNQRQLYQTPIVGGVITEEDYDDENPDIFVLK